jgi:hypothetical protein
MELEEMRAQNDKEIASIKAGSKGTEQDGAYSALTNMAADAEGTLIGQIRNFDTSGKTDHVDREWNTTNKFLADMIANPNKYTQSQKDYMVRKYMGM